MPEATQPSEATRLWAVIDLNATAVDNDGNAVPRTHAILGDRGQVIRYKLVNDKPHPMPEAHARQFLKDSGFQVLNHRGIVVPALEPEQQERIAPSRLSPKYVIAAWSELTDDALLTRAGVRAGFDALPPNPDRTTLIDFLEGQMQALEPTGSDDGDLSGDGVEAAGADLAANLLNGGE